MDRIGTGKGIAALLNGRAKRVTPKVVRALRHALPDAQILVSEDFDQARRHVQHLLEDRPLVVLSGGGDGGVVKLLNLMREFARGKPMPPVGVLKLGTGNGWARAVGAPDYFDFVKEFSRYPRELPTHTSSLVEVEQTLCQFGGVGWDARILNDYLRNLDKRSSQLVGSRLATKLHKGLGGYLYSVARITLPEEWALLRAQGQARVKLTNLADEAYTVDELGRPFRLTGSSTGRGAVLFDGTVSVASASITPEFGFGFRAFPFARAKPGFMNVRIYERPMLEATRNIVGIWRGAHPMPGMNDFFLTHAEMTFSRPMPFQIGGDGLGVRERIEFRVAPETVEVVDWKAARAIAG